MGLKHLVESTNTERTILEGSIYQLLSELKHRSYFVVQDTILFESETETVDVAVLKLYEQKLKNSLLAMDIRDIVALTENEDKMLTILETEVDDSDERLNFLQTSHKGGIGRVQQIEKEMEDLKKQASELKQKYIALKKEKEDAVPFNKQTHADINKERGNFKTLTKPDAQGFSKIPLSQWQPQKPEQKKMGMMDRLKGLNPFGK